MGDVDADPDSPHATTRKRRLPPAERRRLIEEAAEDLFAERGYAGTTIDDVVARAGVSKPMLYRHFESKQELMMHLLERHRDRLAAAPLEEFIRTSGGDVEAQLDAMLEAWFGYVVAHPFVRLLLENSSGDDEIAGLVEELHARQRAADVALLRELAPHIPEPELEPLGEWVRCTLSGLGLFMLERREQGTGPVIAAARRVFRAFLRPERRHEQAQGRGPQAEF